MPIDIIRTYEPPVQSVGRHVVTMDGTALADPAIIIQPYGSLLVAYGELDDMRSRYTMLHGVDPDCLYVLVPFAQDVPGGLTADQAAWLINALGDPSAMGAVSDFYRHLCLDDDIRRWIDKRMSGDEP